MLEKTTLFSKRALKHYKLMQYHELMARKHKRKARLQYVILARIFKHDEELLQNVLKEMGKENTELCKSEEK